MSWLKSSLHVLVSMVVAVGVVACSGDDTEGMGAPAGSGGSSTAGAGGSSGGSGGSAGSAGTGMSGAGGATGGASGADAGPRDGGSDAVPPVDSGSDAAPCRAAGTIMVTNQGMSAYLIDGVPNAPLTLCRGSTYTFAVNATGHPFYIKTVAVPGAGNAYYTGVGGNGTSSGNVAFIVPASAPDTLYYICSLHPGMQGTIRIVN